MLDQSKSGAPYYLPISVPLTATPAEEIEAQSGDPYGTVDVLGLVTDIPGAAAKFTRDGGRVKLFSSDYIPLATLAATPDSGLDVIAARWPAPLRLTSGQRLDASVRNDGGEGAGKIVAVCSQPNTPSVDLPEPGAREVIEVASGFAVADAVNEVGDPVPSEKQTFDFVLEGFYTTLDRGEVRIIDADGRFWMRQFTPAWAIAGRLSFDWQTLKLAQPYLLRAFKQIQVEFKNVAGGTVESTGSLFLIGHRPA